MFRIHGLHFAMPIALGLRMSFSWSPGMRRLTSLSDAPSYSASDYPANDPMEDRHVVKISPNFRLAAVFDGHGGWQVSNYSAAVLPELIIQNTADCKDENCYRQMMEASFLAVEHSIVESVRAAYKLGIGNVASIGSCAVIAVVKDDHLVVSNLGDCRAVIGSISGDKYSALTITQDHNAREPREVEILKREHPDERDIVICKSHTACYVKGRLQLTRALGDAYLKYPEFNEPLFPHRSAGRKVNIPYTPPYVKTIPDVFYLPLEPEYRFLILASDGLWDFISPQEAVEFVANHHHQNPNDVSAMLVERVLQVAAAESRLTVEQLKALPLGARRNRHDDTTVVVLYF